jgi:hypothetical protein
VRAAALTGGAAHRDLCDHDPVVRAIVIAVVIAAFGVHHMLAVGAAPAAHHAPACVTCDEEGGALAAGGDALGLCVAVLTAMLALPGLRRLVRVIGPEGRRGGMTAWVRAAAWPLPGRAPSPPTLCVLLR